MRSLCGLPGNHAFVCLPTHPCPLACMCLAHASALDGQRPACTLSIQQLFRHGSVAGYTFNDTSMHNVFCLCQVGSVTWNLGKHLPALKAAPTIYSFGLEHTRHIYYCLILPPGEVLVGEPLSGAFMHLCVPREFYARFVGS